MLPRFERPVLLDSGAAELLGDVRSLMELEAAEFTALLGQPLILDSAEVGRATDALMVRVDPTISSARLEADLVDRRVLMTIADPAQMGSGFNLLHSLAHESALVVSDSEVDTCPEVYDRIRAEVGNIYPSFALRGLDWDGICERHAHLREVEGDEQFWNGALRWIAELGDAHTQLVRPGRRHHPPYLARMGPESATLVSVPDDSAAWDAGVRPGDHLIVDDGQHWLDTVGASPQHHELVAGRRFMMMTTPTRQFTAHIRSGTPRTWTEQATTRDSVVVNGPMITIRHFTPEVPHLLRAALGLLRGRTDTVTLDLRGNTGGNLVAAAESRRLFAHDDGWFGTVAFTTGRGTLAEPAPLSLARAADAWTGRLQVLVDAVTYSAAEDFLHPLVGQPGIRIGGGPTGVGSGRPHTRALKDGVRLAVSTAITYMRDGRPIEYHGIT